MNVRVLLMRAVLSLGVGATTEVPGSPPNVTDRDWVLPWLRRTLITSIPNFTVWRPRVQVALSAYVKVVPTSLSVWLLFRDS